MCGIFSAGSDGAILVDLAFDPAEARRHLMLVAALGHQLHADANAEERLALFGDAVGQRIDHAGNRFEPALAIGKRADARQHDALGFRHGVRIARHRNRLVVAALARRALERLGGRVQIARTVIDDGDAHERRPGCGNRPMMSLFAAVLRGGMGGRRRDRRRRRCCGRRRNLGRPVHPLGKEAPFGIFFIVADDNANVGPAPPAIGPAPQACRFQAEQQRRSATRSRPAIRSACAGNRTPQPSPP